MSAPGHGRADGVARRRVEVTGVVQGVGFRPFVFGLATRLGLAGFVGNDSRGVFAEVQGSAGVLDEFERELVASAPPLSVVERVASTEIPPVGDTSFVIVESAATAGASTLVSPDVGMCADCLAELFDPNDRRYRYPFTNCTNCGPRFSIIERLPYDRERTSMKTFTMCPECAREYHDPLDRRFHAQPNACPVCGPSLAIWDCSGVPLEGDPLGVGVDVLDKGGIVAVKGLGGFLLMADAQNDEAVATLRVRKHRDAKPFALMFPCLADVERECETSVGEARVLTSPESPIVLMRRRARRTSSIATSVAPSNPYLGAMLPSTPLHHLLMGAVGRPLVATSGNLADEPICVDEREAVRRLNGIADLFLVHNRPIVRHVDDSIVRVQLGREMVLRRARGYAPLPVQLPQPAAPVLAVGAHLKNTIGVNVGKSVFLSQHIGDLESAQATDAFERVIAAFRDLYRVEPARVVCDLHPDYVSTKYAATLGLPVVRVQHHFAHVAACMAENELDDPVLGVSWDGTGYGADGTVWGGEFLVPRGGSFDRVATLRPFRLPGGERAIREPRRTAFGLLFEIFGNSLLERTALAPVAAFEDREKRLLVGMLDRGVNSPMTTSAGRLFDAVTSLCGLCHRSGFEGQAAMALEFAIDERADGAYSIPIKTSLSPRVLDWQPAVEAILGDLAAGVSVGAIALRFHRALVAAIVEVAKQVDLPRVVLTGGCFQNRFLLEHAVQRLGDHGFRAYWHQRVPTNDGGIALGQAVVAARMARERVRQRCG